jgi:hypothetical protein
MLYPPSAPFLRNRRPSYIIEGHLWRSDMIHNRSLWAFIQEERRRDLIETLVSLKKN